MRVDSREIQEEDGTEESKSETVKEKERAKETAIWEEEGWAIS